MSEFRFDEKELKTVKYFRSLRDNRIVGVFISGQFDEYAKYPPYLDTPEEIEHQRLAYKNADPEVERRTKAHITEDHWPLQIIMLERMPGGTTMPHYHVPDQELPRLPTRHQILICQRGAARVDIYTTENEHVGGVVLGKDDLILMLEGHKVEFLEPRTKLIEIKQGPFPENDVADKVDLPQGVAEIGCVHGA